MKTAEYLEALKGGKVQLEILIRGKDADENNKIWDKILEAIKSAGNKLGILKKVKLMGPFGDEWKSKYETISKEVEEVDITTALSVSALATKDESELVSHQNARSTSWY
jgi:nucleosome binding factor SPN SPT16 subunit